MRNRYRGVKHRALKNILRENAVEDEQIAFEVIGQFQSDELEMDDFKSGVWFATNYRTGVVSDAPYEQGFIFNNIFMLRSLYWNSEESIVNMVFAQDGHTKNLEKDTAVTFRYTNETGVGELMEGLMNLRFAIPMIDVDEPLNSIYKLIPKGPAEQAKALNQLEKLQGYDPLCGVLDVLIARTLESLGEGEKATLKLAKIWNETINLTPSALFKEFWQYPWHAGALRYLPQPQELSKGTDYEKVQYHFISGLHSFHSGETDAGLINILKAFSVFINFHEEDDLEAVFDLFISLIKMASWVKESSLEAYEECSRKLYTKITSIKADPEIRTLMEEDDSLREMIEIASSFMDDWRKLDYENLHRFLKVVDQKIDSEMIMSELLEQERFEEASKQKLELQRCDPPEEWSMSSTIDLDIDAWEAGSGESALVFQVEQLFARYRAGLISVPNAFEEVEQLLASGKCDLLISNNEEPYLLLHLLKAELLCKMGKPGIPELAYNVRKNVGHAFGRIIQNDLLRYGDAFLEFFTAWHYKTIIDMEIQKENVPTENPFKWFHEMAAVAIAQLKDTVSDSFHADVEVLTAIASLTEGIQGFATSRQDQINHYDELSEAINSILEGLNQKELRISIGGETSAGKTTFLNTLFNTDMFYVTPEEATGIPTEIRRGESIKVTVYDSTGNPVSTFNESGRDFQAADGAVQIDLIREFIKEHTRVSENGEVAWVTVHLPVEDLPEDLILIDTPGFNANEKRSNIARQVIQNSHACIFVIDARNALKSGEMEVLEATREEVGKTFYILNKMDLVLGDDELDCDADAAGEIIKRVVTELEQRFELSEVMLHPVSSISIEDQPAHLHADIKPYIENLNLFRKDIFQQTVKQKLYFLIDSAVKQSVRLTEDVKKHLEAVLAAHLQEELKLRQSIPESFSLFRDELEARLWNSFNKGLGQYYETMHATLNREIESCNNNMISWLNQTTSKDVLKEKVQQKAKKYIEHMTREIGHDRVEAQKRLVSLQYEELATIFQELYSELPFKADFSKKNLIDNKSNYKISSSIIHDSSEGLDTGIGGAVGGAAAGIAIGAILGGPIGAAIGGWVGSSIFGKSIDDMKQELHQSFAEGLDKAIESIAESLDAEMDSNYQASFIKKLGKVIDAEIGNYERLVNTEIEKHSSSWQTSFQESLDLREQSAAILNQAEQLKLWRIKRKSLA